MIELSNTNAQVLAAGQSATFDTVLLHTGCAECHRKNTGTINLNARSAIYEVSFNCNIGATEAGDAAIGITLDGSPLPETIGTVVTTAAGDTTNVAGSTYIFTCCGNNANTILLTNTGTTDLNLAAYPRLSVKRLA